MQTGNRTLSIASINPDNFMNPEKQRQITNMLLTNKIHIAAIQETHLAHDTSYIMNGYRIITSASKKHPEQPLTGMTKGGVAILIHTELAHYISNIQRIDHRIMTVTLHDKPGDIHITIMVTYAPHTGYSKKEKAEHWQNAKHTLTQIPKRHLTIWRADANGQLGPVEEQKEEYRKIIGPHTLATQMEPGNGTSIGKACLPTNMIPMNTWKRTPLTKHEKREILRTNKPELLRKQLLQNKTHTWTHPTGMTARQIDYIMINNKYRNTVKRAWAIHGWQGNMEQQRQHAVIRMDITLNLMKKYHQKHKPESGTEIKYDIKQLRTTPEKCYTGLKNGKTTQGQYIPWDNAQTKQRKKSGQTFMTPFPMDYNTITQSP